MESKTIKEWMQYAKDMGYSWWYDGVLASEGEWHNSDLKAESLSEAISKGWDWRRSSRGHNHWSHVYENLLKQGK